MRTQHIFEQPHIQIFLEPLFEVLPVAVEQTRGITGRRRGIFRRGFPDLVFCAVCEPEDCLAELFHKLVVLSQDGEIALFNLNGRIDAQGGIANEHCSCDFSIHRFQQIERAALKGEDCAFTFQPEGAYRHNFLAYADRPQLLVSSFIICQSFGRLRRYLSPLLKILCLGQSNGDGEYQRKYKKALHIEGNLLGTPEAVLNIMLGKAELLNRNGRKGFVFICLVRLLRFLQVGGNSVDKSNVAHIHLIMRQLSN